MSRKKGKSLTSRTSSGKLLKNYLAQTNQSLVLVLSQQFVNSLNREYEDELNYTFLFNEQRIEVSKSKRFWSGEVSDFCENASND